MPTKRARKPKIRNPKSEIRNRKWVYLFHEGNAHMRDLLGGKGAGLAEMTRAKLPVPPGFTITTQACNAYSASKNKFSPGMWRQTLAANFDELYEFTLDVATSKLEKDQITLWIQTRLRAT